MNAGERQNRPGWRGLVVLLAAFFGLTAGLCAIFALVATGVQAWQEHVQAQWPVAPAEIEQCGLVITSHKWGNYRIDCALRYTVRGAEVVSHVWSRSATEPRRVIWQYPPNQFEMLQGWVDAHPAGTAVAVRYDPARPRKAVLAAPEMPLSGSATPANLTLLGFFTALCVVLLGMARVARPRAEAVPDTAGPSEIVG